MKTLLIYGTCLFVAFLTSCKKDVAFHTMQKAELELYTYENNTTSVKVEWKMGNTAFFSKESASDFTEKISLRQEDTLRVKITPAANNSLLDVYFKLTVNDITVRTARFYNDSKAENESLELIFYNRVNSQYKVFFEHQSDANNDDVLFQVNYLVNDSICSNGICFIYFASECDWIGSQLLFRIPSSGFTEPVKHKTFIWVNDEIVRCESITRASCGSHSSEMRVKMVPYI